MPSTPSNPFQVANATHLKVFLSYSRNDDAPRVETLFVRMRSEALEFDVSLDRIKFYGGQPWRNQIQSAIDGADVIIIWLSHRSLSNTEYQQKEFAEILANAQIRPNRQIILVRLEECPVPESLAPHYRIDLFAPDGYQRLLQALKDFGNHKSGSEVRSSVDTSQPPGKKAAPQKRSRQARKSIIRDATTGGAAQSPDDGAPEQGKQLEDEPAQSDAYPGTVLRPGSAGDEVREAQQRLKDLGFSVLADGVFRASTHEAVVAFQQQRGLDADGLVGPSTWAALFSKVPDDLELPDDSKLPDDQGNGISGDPGTAQSIKQGLAEEARQRNALNDKPIDNVNKDTLGFKDYVFALRDFVASQSTTTPLTISINGAWGSGKSSLMRMLQQQLEPELVGLWRLQLRWLAGWFWGTLFWGVAQIMMKAGTANADYIRLGFAFDPPEDVTSKNFDQLFEKFVDYSIKDLPVVSAQRNEEREWRLKKTRFWARQAARRRKMTPRQHPTVWFNAWKFNQQEQVWAALATAVLSQLKGKYGFFARLGFVTQLTFKRTDKLGTLKHVFRKFAVPIILAVVVVVYELNRQRLAAYLNLPSLSGRWSWLSERLVWLVPALAAAWQALKAIDDPFKLPTEDLIDQPDYKAKIGFIGTFEEDFQRIVRVAVRRSIFWKPRKLVIFIDDLDRCSPAQTAGIVEAINLFLDSVGCVFILGMDMAAVAISIEVKYKELAQRMREDAPDSISPGVLFLDKIVQIPFNVPRPNRPYINALVKQITEPVTQALPTIRLRTTATSPSQNGSQSAAGSDTGVTTTAKTLQTPASYSPAPVIDRAGFAQSDIRAAIAFASNLLKENPRQVKRFINLFRLQVYVAHERGMLSDGNDFGLTPRKLAVWVAWYMQWPDILKHLSSPANSRDLRRHLASVSEKHLARVNDADPDAGWCISNRHAYINELKETRASRSDEIIHWSRLPWPLWIRDSYFLQCLKELERYWREPELLESILDMTQVTAGPVGQSAASLPTLTSPSAEDIAVVSNRTGDTIHA